jgi:4-hydroxy-tetrahydrodipicolinate synthase
VMIPALKAAISHWGGDAGWAAVRPPLVELDAAQASALVAQLQSKGFDMPGLASTR